MMNPRLYYKEVGDPKGPLLMFLHGGGVAGWMWENQIDHFSDYHCIVPDLPQHGRSQHIPFSIADSAKRLITLIEEKSAGKKVTVIGFSLGAQVLIQMLSLKPYLIHNAIINSALVREIPFAKLTSLLVKMTFPLIKNRTFSKIQAKSLYLTGHQFEKYYQETSHLTLEALLKVLEENRMFRFPEGFSHAQTNILVTVGEKEPNVMKKSAMDLVKEHPHCQGIILPQVGHGISLARPDLFNQMINRWINDGELINECKVIQK